MINYKTEKAEIVTIGANEAKYLLDLNIKNRKQRNSIVAQYMNDIKNDKFEFNGSSIVVSDSGVLLDGQHRLMALETAMDKFIKVVLVTGVKEETMETIDTGAKRRAGDVLALNNIKNSKNVSAMVKNVLEEFGLNSKSEYGIRTRKDKECTSKIVIQYTNQEILDEYLKNRIIYDEAIEFANGLYNSGTRLRSFSPSVYGAFYVLLSRENKQEAKNFLREISMGTKHKECNTAISLRGKLLNVTIKKTALSIQEVRDMIVYYFRKYVDNKEVQKYVREQAAFKKLND